jgi:hypothetical protein
VERNNYYWYKNILGVDETSARKLILWVLKGFVEGQYWVKATTANWLTNTILLNTFKMDEYNK